MSKQLTIKDVAKIMGKSERTVYRYVKTGKLSAVNVKNKKGYEYKIPEESIRQFQCQNVNSNCQSQNVNVKAVKIAEYKELLMRH
ncbi:MAG: helix-turn-helix domain-containing protein, partial [Candidatus Thermoplasmatota archaeon]